jgi:hypothetical protein
MKTLSKSKLVILFAIYSIFPILSLQEFFYYFGSGGSRYDNSWQVLLLNSWSNYDFSYVIFSFLIILFTLSPIVFIIIINNYIKNRFPSVREAFYYYKELNRVNKASRKMKEKQRLEKVRQEYKQKLAQLEEEKKKYL